VSELVVPKLDWPIPIDDPYPTLDEMRDERYVHYLPGLDSHLVVAHGVAKSVLGGPEWSVDQRRNLAVAARLESTGAGDLMAKSVLFSDPPNHQRLRRSLGGHLTPNAVEQLRPRIKSIVEMALSGIRESETFDLMDTVAYPVPLAVICELLDVDGDVAQVLRTETPKITAMLDPLASQDEIDAGSGAAFGALLELIPLVADRRSNPGSDLLSALAVGTSEHPSLESNEALMMALLLLAAGHETTANLVGNAVVTLHNDPDQASWLREHPDQCGAAIDELLRFESPVQIASRVAKNSVNLDGVVIEAGRQVLVSIGAANRDPAFYPNPSRLNLSGGVPGHLAFGFGSHFCAGAALARVEAHEILSCLLALDPPLEQRTIELTRSSSATFRRIESLCIGGV
jgi:cytochrome P450